MFSPETAASQGIPVQALGHGLAALLVVNMVISLQAVGAVLTLGLLIAPMIWTRVLHITPDSALLVLASHPYEPGDYIRDYRRFLALSSREQLQIHQA